VPTVYTSDSHRACQNSARPNWSVKLANPTQSAPPLMTSRSPTSWKACSTL
jgi:hypothetical protein